MLENLTRIKRKLIEHHEQKIRMYERGMVKISEVKVKYNINLN